MNIIYSYIIYLDRGRLAKRGKYGKTSGWEEVHKQVIKDLGLIPAWRRGISGKTPACCGYLYIINYIKIHIEYLSKTQDDRITYSQL
jgi:hypothetical protein